MCAVYLYDYFEYCIVSILTNDTLKSVDGVSCISKACGVPM